MSLNLNLSDFNLLLWEDNKLYGIKILCDQIFTIYFFSSKIF